MLRCEIDRPSHGEVTEPSTRSFHHVFARPCHFVLPAHIGFATWPCPKDQIPSFYATEQLRDRSAWRGEEVPYVRAEIADTGRPLLISLFRVIIGNPGLVYDCSDV